MGLGGVATVQSPHAPPESPRTNYRLASSPDQIFSVCPAALSKNKVWTPSLGKLEPNYKAYRHFVTPIRFLREENKLYVTTDSQLADFGAQDLCYW